MARQDKISVLFVCMGNICRSPTAEAVFREQVKVANLVDDLNIDSAGTHAYHVGEPPDSRAQEAAVERGLDLSRIVGRQVAATDFFDFDYILAMDHDNLDALLRRQPDDSKARVELFLDYTAEYAGQSVPDPYFGAVNGFALVLDLVETASRGLLESIREARSLS